jgi:hypothetical protein
MGVAGRGIALLALTSGAAYNKVLAEHTEQNRRPIERTSQL